MFGGTWPGSVKADGTFVLQNVAEGNYDVAVFGFPDGYYVKSVRAGTDEMLDVGLNVARGKAIPALDVVLSGAGGRVEGLVTNEDALPISGALVVLIPERRTQTNLYKTTTTDQYGRFSVKGIRPGEYKLFAWEDIEPGIYHDAEFLKPLESRGRAVRIEESSGHAVELKLIPATPPGK